jgi:hypothetical protein
MPYGILKCDTVTFTDDGVDKSVSISGLVQNPTFSGNVTVTGTISGVTVTGTTASFTSGNFTNISGGTHTITSGVFAAGSAANPSISFTSDPNTGIYSPGADQVAISTNGTGRFSIDANGNVAVDTNTLYVDAVNNRVAVGTASPSHPLQVGAGFAVNGGVVYWGEALTGNNRGILSWGTNLATVGAPQSIALFTNSSERARIDSSGRLLVGTSTARSGVFYNGDPSTPTIQLEGTTSNTCYSATRVANGSGDAVFIFAKARGTAVGNTTVVQSADGLGSITFQGADGSEFVEAARISAEVDGTPGANDMPGRLVFSTTADGASSPTERMRITSGGSLLIGQTLSTQGIAGIILQANGYGNFIRNDGSCIYTNRRSDDGTLVEFAQADVTEGTISVSGTTVSYNGAHLSRWSQLPSGAERVEILRGTVLSNIDEMCEWGDEDNEQLNRMKVSNVEGDRNVSGVFQAWDDDDDTYTNDFYCAMTGDFVIRIGAGATVERGDLLMSAGDGTAKPQDDDIIRSKTIAKVTSTNVSCTYPDGSYCVPCVLMAC